MAEKKKDTTTFLLRGIPTDIWNEYQALARKEGVSAVEKLRKHIKATVKRKPTCENCGSPGVIKHNGMTLCGRCYSTME